jgi:hypothetical protein
MDFYQVAQNRSLNPDRHRIGTVHFPFSQEGIIGATGTIRYLSFFILLQKVVKGKKNM